jgi:hypothetical protein
MAIIMKAVVKYRRVASVQAEAFYVLYRLSMFELDARQVVAGMGIEACCMGMQSCDQDPEVQYWAVKVLSNMIGYTEVDLAYWRYLQKENAYLPIEMAIRLHHTEGGEVSAIRLLICSSAHLRICSSAHLLIPPPLSRRC